LEVSLFASEKIFASCSDDGIFSLWDIKSANSRIMTVSAHAAEIFSCDFHKYNEQIITASQDNSVKVWDLRNTKEPMRVLVGHRHSVRQVKCSPHEGAIIATVS